MKKKAVNPNDVAEVMAQIQEQLAVLDRKFDQFMTKSLKDIADVLAHSKPAQVVHVPAPAPRTNDRPARQMYAVVCFDCGKDTEIPFKPSGDRPVYCKECFAKRRGQPSKPAESKPQGFSIAPATAAPEAKESPEPKKKTAAKKTATKSKPAAKKKAKKK